ncbi:MAG: hypothetical protein HRU19_01485 [Pseudobacteriovorax sp.]|nr:hypothetical protein [Pseudobacteriovorax sp.]
MYRKLVTLTLGLGLCLSTMGEARSRGPVAEFLVDKAKVSGSGYDQSSTLILEEDDGFSILFLDMILDLPYAERYKETKRCQIRIPMKVGKSRTAFAMKQVLTYGVQKSKNSFGKIEVNAGVASKSKMINQHFRKGEMNIPLTQREFYIPMRKQSRGRKNLCIKPHDFSNRGRTKVRTMSIDLTIEGSVNSGGNDYLFLAADAVEMRYRVQIDTKKCKEDY